MLYVLIAGILTNISSVLIILLVPRILLKCDQK
jgi:hypothetical protein